MSKQLSSPRRRSAAVLLAAARPVFEPLEARQLFTLLGIDLSTTFPVIEAAAPGSIQSQPGTPNLFSATSTNIELVQSTTQVDPISTSTVTGSAASSIQIFVDNTGNLLGGAGSGTPGQDLIVQGDVTIQNGSSSTTYDGVLLTGTIEQFGYELDNSPFPAFIPNQGSFDFRFHPTGGLLNNVYFTNSDIGVEISGTTGTTFGPNAFGDGFSLNEPKALIGPIGLLIPQIVPPTITTVQMPATATVGTVVSDQATVASLSPTGPIPTGTVSFNLYNNPTASGTPLFTDTETLVGGVATSANYTPAATGTDYWVDTYSGDSHYTPITSGVTAEPLVITPSTPKINTTQQPATAVVGSSVADKAAVTSGFNPTGTVTFNLYPNAAGTGTPLFTDTEALVGGVATSAGYTTIATGTDSWVATYNGDGNNVSVSSPATSEPVVITPSTPLIVTHQQPPTAVVGSSVADQAVVSGGLNPTGTVTFNLYNNATASGTPLFTDSNEPLVAGVAMSKGYTSLATGTDYWVATYSGDSNNASVTSGVALEPVVLTPSTPNINTTQQPATAVVGSSVADKATVGGGFSPTGTVTFALYGNAAGTGTPLFTDTETLVGGVATSKGYTTTATGTDSWVATYNGDTNNVSVSSPATSEPVVITPSTPNINTTQQPATAVVGSSVADKATVGGGVSPTGTVTFNLYPNAAGTGTPLFTDTETLVGGVATSKGFTTTATGTDSWVATYNGDSNNKSVSSPATSEPVVITPGTPGINTTPSVTTTTGSGGQFATIGFWHNKNGQAVIFGLGSTLGTSLASTYPNLFASPNPYDSATLASLPGSPTTLAGLSSTQVASVYEGLWTPSGSAKNTYVQAFAVALGLNSTGGLGSFNVGSNGAMYGVANNTLQPISLILKTIANNFNPTTGLFYGGDATQTGNANTILNAINTAGETPGGIPMVGGAETLNDSATLSGGVGETGTITFYLMAPGATSSTPLTAAVYTDTVTVVGNGTYTTATGTNPGGFSPTATGTYQWVAVYSGDSKNSGVTSSFGSEPAPVGPQSETFTTTPSTTSVVLGTSAVTLKDTATIQGGTNPTGTITWTLFLNGTQINSATQSTPVSGNGNYSTPTGYTLSTTGSVIGTYQWDASYSGDTNNVGDSDNNDPSERTVVSPASPAINTTPGATVTLGSGVKLTDSAALSGGYNETGSVTFYLFAPGVSPNANDSNNVYSDVVPVSGNGTYTTAAGSNPGGYLPTTAGTYQWVAVYGGDSNNNAVTSPFTSEPETASPTPPTIVTSPSVTTTTGVSGCYGSIGYWSCQTGQSCVSNCSTNIGAWGASNCANLFGCSNQYTSGYLSSCTGSPKSWGGLSNSQCGSLYNSFCTSFDIHSNTYVQACGVAFGLCNSGGNGGSYNIGTNGAAFGCANNTVLTCGQILQCVNNCFNSSTGQFCGGNNSLCTQLNNVLCGINNSGCYPTMGPVCGGTELLNDTATLSGGMNPTGTITFYLFAPGVTPNATDSNNVYTDTVTISGNGSYSTNPTNKTGSTNPGGYTPMTTGTYQWIAVYNGDANNIKASDAFGSEPQPVGKSCPAIFSTTPNYSSVTLGSTSVTLKDSADLEQGMSPTGTITWTLFLNNGASPVYTVSVPVNGNGIYTTPGYTLPTTGNVTGTYQWDSTYSGDANNASDSDVNNATERTVVSPASPCIVTNTGPSVMLGSGVKFTDSATISGGYNETGSIEFFLFAPGVSPNSTGSNAVYTDTVTINGNGTYTTSAGNNPGGYLPTVAGTYQWLAYYNGDGNNNYALSAWGSEPETAGANGSISGTKFQDMTGDGFSADDVPLAGVTINLYVNGGTNPIASTVTTSNGTYSFNNLVPGNYFVQEAVPANWVETGGASGYGVTVQSGTNSTCNNFDDYHEVCNISEVSCISYLINGCTRVTTLAGNTHEGDQVQVTFTLAPGDNDTISIVSYTAPDSTFNASDAYEQVVFDSATGTYTGGTHTLCITIPLCYYQIDFICGPVICQFGPAGSNSFYHAQNRIFDSDNSGTDACYNGGAELSGSVYNDVNKDKTDDGKDTGLAGVIVTLTGTDSSGRKIHLTRTTGADGSFDFMGLKAGTYTLVETQPSGYTSDATDVGVVNGKTDGSAVNYAGGEITNIVLTFNADGTSYDFGEVKS